MMTCCAPCAPLATQFDQVAGTSLERYRRRGPLASTRILVNAIRRVDTRLATVLDVGCGVGVADHELLSSGSIERVTLVDASDATLAAARSEMERRQTLDRAVFCHGDFMDLASDILPADVVLLDRVVCCYADMAGLLARSADHANRLLGIVYPRSAWWVRLGTAAENALRRMRGSTFRTFVHSPGDMDATLRHAGFERRTYHRGVIWVVALYERISGREL
jgi:magnesium-protoporphyrin O-methyltransferase